ncbi:MAG TPA: Gfo/Idh/MocA family oxidoreductase [Roseiflexaceae bacterium]|nr:Gfo/Idh/MocA family oxidoreductase [Roseiflexaceae bacterium]
MTTTPTRWGIIGTGRIAGVFAEGLRELPDAQLVAVGSRAQESAEAFGARHGASRRYASYEAVAADPEVDAVYIATPHSAHAENTIMCLEAGKAVLCEKPFAINARQAARMVAVARERRVFLMEAMWTRFLPVLVRVRQLLAEGAIGEVRMVTSDFGFRTTVNPKSRLFDPALGGGGLLDVGVYPISLASMVFGGEPERIASMADIGETGVDEQGAAILGYGPGRMAIVWTAVRTNTPHETTILGAEGRIRIHPPSWCPTAFTISRPSGEERVELPFPGNGYQFEAAEVARCLRAGRLESDVMPLDETLAIVRTMDRIRAQWGLRYPME